MNANSDDILLQFNDFYQNSPDEFADFELVKNPKKKLKTLLGNEEKPAEFQVIGQHGTGSLIAFWRHNKNIDFICSPIVWLSSEGFPNSVFASSFESFLSIFPYGTGFIYDALCNYYFHKQSPKLQPSPKQKFTPTKMKSYLNQNKKHYKGHADFLAWLNNDMKIVLADNPLSIIEEAILNHTDLASWLENKGVRPLK